MSVYAIIQNNSLVKITEDVHEAKRQEQIPGRKWVNVICRTKNEYRMLMAMAELAVTLKRGGGEYFLSKVNGLGSTDDQVVANLKSCVNDLIGITPDLHGR